jgi:hypothetical protein
VLSDEIVSRGRVEKRSCIILEYCIKGDSSDEHACVCSQPLHGSTRQSIAQPLWCSV